MAENEQFVPESVGEQYLARAEARRNHQEPEGGYGGKDGIANTSATNASEHPGRTFELDEHGLSGGETATERARVLGEDVPDVKPAPHDEADEVAEKRAAKKTAGEGEAK